MKIVFTILILAGLYLIGKRKKSREEVQSSTGGLKTDTPQDRESAIQAHLGALGDPSSAVMEGNYLRAAETGDQVPFGMTCFPPDGERSYRRYLSVKLANSLSMATGLAAESYFDLCFCSSEEDGDIILDMLNLSQYMIDQTAFIEGDCYFFTLPREEGPRTCLAIQTAATAESLSYNGITVPLLTMIPLQEEDRQWISEKNNQWGSRLGARIYREWLEYRGHSPLGKVDGSSLYSQDGNMMDQMCEELGAQMAEGGRDWMSKCQDPDFVKVFQSFVARNSCAGSTNDEIRELGMMMAKGRYDEVIDGYQKLIEKNPGDKALYMDQIGAAYFFKEEYHKAMEHYLEAARGGVPSSDYNLWEVCELLYQKGKDCKYLHAYVDTFPEGESIKQALKLLKKT